MLYLQSERGRATQARYFESDKWRLTRARYRQSDEYRAAARMKQARYRETAEYREWLARHQQTDAYRTRTARHRQSEKYRARQKRYQQTEECRAYHRQWRRTAKGRAVTRSTGAVRRARKHGAQILESVDRGAILRVDDICHLCELAVDPGNFDLDHLIPLAVEAIEAAWNYAAVHRLCNQKKHARFDGIVLTPTARTRWQQRRPAHLAELEAHVARIVAARSDEKAAA